MKRDQRTITSCPEWCNSHFGVHGQNYEFLPLGHEDYPEHFQTIGKHTALVLKERNLLDETFPCQAVRVEQDEAVEGRQRPVIEFWHGHPYVRNEPEGEIPQPARTHHPITAIEARRLGEALIKAAELVEAILQERCSCGEPVATLGDECKACWLKREWAEMRAERLARRSHLTILD